MQYYPQVFIGSIQSTEDVGLSAIYKEQVSGLLQLSLLGLIGDEQAEKRFHGGPDRALSHYPTEHYQYWRQLYPEIAELFVASAFGENLSTIGMDERTVFIGDIYHWGEAIIQVTQPRSPCYKTNKITQVADFALIMQDSGRCGWLYRVLKAGSVSSKSPLQLLSRNSDISVKEAISIAFHRSFDISQYRRLLAAAGLSASWSLTMQNRIQNLAIEDFSHRLFGFKAN